jgi:hypothetical protein
MEILKAQKMTKSGQKALKSIPDGTYEAKLDLYQLSSKMSTDLNT